MVNICAIKGCKNEKYPGCGVSLFKAAFENVSKITIRPLNREESIDFRTARLPTISIDSQTDFNPYEHRDPKRTIPLWMAYLNVLRIGFGAGVLGIPLAISQIGIVLGTIIALSTGMLIIHTHKMLLRCLYKISTRLKIPRISYRYGFRMALLHGPPCCQSIGKHGPCLIGTFMLFSQLGICTVFILFTSDSLRDLMDWETSTPSYFVLLPAYLILEYFMKNVKIISYVSMLGNVMNLVGLILVCYHIFEDPHGEVVMAITNASNVMFAFGSFLFNLSAIGVILSMDKLAKDPSKITSRFGVINVGILVPVVVATVFGCLGYWAFGTMEENVLRYLPFDTPTAMAAIGLYMVSIAFAYPIQCYPAISIILEVIKNHDRDNEPTASHMKCVEIVARPVFVVTSFIIAYLVPFQGPFVAFVGNLCTTILALVFPALMDICLMYPGPYGKFSFYLIKDLLIILFGMVAFVFGVGLCGYLIYVRIMSSYAPRNSEFN